MREGQRRRKRMTTAMTTITKMVVMVVQKMKRMTTICRPEASFTSCYPNIRFEAH